MKKILFALLLVTSFMSCENEDIMITDTAEATILGKWRLVGFDDVIRYEFTEEKRFGIYVNDDGTFPEIGDLLAENPDFPSHSWEYDGETVVIDLNFGNFSRLVPHFTCDNQVIKWIDEDGSNHSTYYREGHDISACD